MFVFIFKWNRAMAQAVSCRPCTAEDRVRNQTYTREISGELSLKEFILQVLCPSPVVSLSCCVPLLLCPSPVVSLSCCVPLLLCPCHVVSLSCCVPVLLCPCPVVSLSCCVPVLLCPSPLTLIPTLKFNQEQAVKAQRGSRVIALLFP
jgi:hypothetical protein